MTLYRPSRIAPLRSAPATHARIPWYCTVVRWWLLVLLALGCSRREEPTPAPGTAQIRVISLTPSATEVIHALGATAQLVGVDDYSLYPEEVKKLPKVGSFMTPNLETIVSLRPTLVVVDDVHGPAAGAMRDAGLVTVEVPIHAMPDIKKALTILGGKLGRVTEASRAVAEIDAAIEAARAKRPAKRPRVLAILDREASGLGNLVAAGPGSWIDELLAICGGENVLAASGVRYPKLSMEEVVRGNPDVILDLSFPARKSITEWNVVDVPAVKQGRVSVMSDPTVISPSPRIKHALELVATALAEKP